MASQKKTFKPETVDEKRLQRHVDLCSQIMPIFTQEEIIEKLEDFGIQNQKIFYNQELDVINYFIHAFLYRRKKYPNQYKIGWLTHSFSNRILDWDFFSHLKSIQNQRNKSTPDPNKSSKPQPPSEEEKAAVHEYLNSRIPRIIPGGNA